MKILLVMDCNIGFINGVTQSVIHLSKGLAELGHDVRILMPAQDGKAGMEERTYLVPSVRFDSAYPGMRLACPMPRKLRKALTGWKPDVVHSNTEGGLYFAAGRIARKTGAKHIHTFHTNFPEFYTHYFPFGEKLSRSLMIAYGRLFFRRLDGMISPSAWAKSVMARFRYSVPYYILPNGIRTELFGADHSAERQEIRRRYGIQEADTLLLFVGRIAAEKNLPQLLTYFDHIRNDRVKLMIVGDGPVLDALRAQAGSMAGKDRILFTGMVPPEKTCAYYGAADIFVTASLSEMQALTYMEAMASGLPVVCSYAPYIDGLVIDGETGYGIRSGTEFAQRAELLAADPLLRCALGEKAKQSVRDRYSVASFARRCMQIYGNVIEGAEDETDGH